MTTPEPNKFELDRLRHRWFVPLFLAVFATLAIVSACLDGVTFDETIHLPAGISYLEKGDFRINTGHPPLAKMWAAAPLLVTHQEEPLAGPAWESAEDWVFGFEMLNGPIGTTERKDPFRLLIPARISMVFMGVLLGLIVYAWARELWGRTGGLIALFLFSLSPTMLAHTRLVTTDLPAALGYTVTLWCFWRFLRQPGLLRCTILGAALGVALLMKYSMVILVPLLFGLLLLWTLRPAGEKGERLRRTITGISGLAGTGLVAFFLIWLCYGFRYSSVPADSGFERNWEHLEKIEGIPGQSIRFARDKELLPEGYLHGTSFMFGFMRRQAFLHGDISTTGWWYYFPVTILLKTPLPLLALLSWLVFVGFRRARVPSYNVLFLAIPVAFYLVIVMKSPMNLGHRHVIPIYPVLFVFAGAASRFACAHGLRAKLFAALLVLYLGSTLLSTPRYLSYFNALAGGSDSGWKYLVDSNIDWGQDLPRLKSWMESNGVSEVHLAYFGTGDPDGYGIRHKKVQRFMDFQPTQEIFAPRKGDYLAISVTLLQGLYYDHDRAFYSAAQQANKISPESMRGWNADVQEAYEENRSFPGLADWMVARELLSEKERKEIESRTYTGFLRYLRENLEPVDKAGDSILIYRMP